MAFPADLASRGEDFLFSGVDAVLAFITEKPCNLLHELTAGLRGYYMLPTEATIISSKIPPAIFPSISIKQTCISSKPSVCYYK
jgi:hypothetical protein